MQIKKSIPKSWHIFDSCVFGRILYVDLEFQSHYRSDFNCNESFFLCM